MQFTPQTTTDDLLAALPTTEDDRWEFKSAQDLSESKRGMIGKELGKQVSAFANSGGGFLVYGIQNVTKALEPCDQLVGRQAMADWLSTKVHQSVEYPIQSFKVHTVPFTADVTNAIYVVEIQDSPAAPHYAKEEQRYFYRLHAHSVPAPHFHLELLRNRMTRAVVEVSLSMVAVEVAESKNENQVDVTARLSLKVQNSSSVMVEHCVLSVDSEEFKWNVVDAGPEWTDIWFGCLAKVCPPPLLPSLYKMHNITLIRTLEYHSFDLFEIVLNELRSAYVIVQPFSQNYQGQRVQMWLRDAMPSYLEKDLHQKVSQFYLRRNKHLDEE